MPTRTVTTTGGISGAPSIIRVGLRALQPSPTNPREVNVDSPGIVELAASIQQVGLLQPLVVRPAEGNDPSDRDSWKYTIVAGHRRLAALHTLPRSSRVWSDGVDVIVRTDLGDGAKPTQAALIENLQRVDLSPLEEARAFATLKDEHGMKQAAIAEAVAKNQGHISKRLALLRLIPDLASRLERGELVLEEAIDAARLPKVAQEKVVQDIIRGVGTPTAIVGAVRSVEALAERGALIKELRAAGTNVIDSAESPGPVEGAVQVTQALWWLSAEAHASCKKRLVWIRSDPQAWRDSPLARWSIEYCLADDPQKLHPRPVESDDVGAVQPDQGTSSSSVAAGNAQPDRSDAAIAEREALRVGADEDRTARRAFQSQLLAGKLPKGTADHLLRQFLADVVAGIELYDVSHLTARAAVMLGNDPGEAAEAGDLGYTALSPAGPALQPDALKPFVRGQLAQVVSLVDARRGGDELLRWALATRFAVDEDAMAGVLAYHADGPSFSVVPHLRFLEAAGYQLSPREEAYLQEAGGTPLFATAVAIGLLEAPEEEPVGDVSEPAATPEAEEVPAEESPAAAAPEAGPLPDDLHTYKRDALVDLAKQRGVATTPAMTKLQIRSALEAAAQ